MSFSFPETIKLPTKLSEIPSVFYDKHTFFFICAKPTSLKMHELFPEYVI